MDLVVFENNKPWVIDEFREGHFDYVELASDVAETKFFQFLFGQQVVDRLVQHYPSPRDRHHVPLWMYVYSQLTLRLHGQHSFHSYPLIVRAGGLVDALGPEVARRQVDPASGNLTLECAGFNDRNLYPRQTPCDQDFLRKLARDTEPESLEEWYNRHVVTVYKELGAFDADGLFIADGTYLFVPDNPRYEGSQRLLFDEHNHPVSKKQEQEMTKAQRARCRWRRCYKVLKLRFFDVCGLKGGLPPFCGFGQNSGEEADHSPTAEEGASRADHAGCTPTVQVVSQARLPEAASPTVGSSLRDRLPHASGQDVSLPCCRRCSNRCEASRSGQSIPGTPLLAAMRSPRPIACSTA